MQVTITSLSDIQQEADILVLNDELQTHFQLAYERYRPKVELRGFRKGRVPMPMIKQLYGEAIERDALDDIANDMYRKAMDEKNIKPLGRPAMIDMDFKRGEQLHFKIHYEVKPEITLGIYKGIAVEKPVHTVNNEETEAEITSIRRANGTSADVTSVTDADHIVIADVQELDESGAPLIGKKTSNTRFPLWDTTLASEIRTALLSARTGETTTLRFESKHEDHAHTVHLAITPTKIEKMTLPPFDDDLVKKITANATTSQEEFRKNLRADIERYWAARSTEVLDDNIAKAIVAAHDFPVPEALVSTLLDGMVEDVRHRTRDQKLPKGFDEKKFRENNREYAVWQGKWILLKERIAAAENITVHEGELEALAAEEAAKTGIAKERLLQYYKESAGTEDRIRTDKLMAFLRSSAKVTEKSDTQQ